VPGGRTSGVYEIVGKGDALPSDEGLIGNGIGMNWGVLLAAMA